MENRAARLAQVVEHLPNKARSMRPWVQTPVLPWPPLPQKTQMLRKPVLRGAQQFQRGSLHDSLLRTYPLPPISLPQSGPALGSQHAQLFYHTHPTEIGETQGLRPKAEPGLVVWGPLVSHDPHPRPWLQLAPRIGKTLVSLVQEVPQSQPSRRQQGQLTLGTQWKGLLRDCP
jgi:hypothetical protein